MTLPQQSDAPDPKRPDHPDECMCPSCVTYWRWEMEQEPQDTYGEDPLGGSWSL